MKFSKDSLIEFNLNFKEEQEPVHVMKVKNEIKITRR